MRIRGWEPLCSTWLNSRNWVAEALAVSRRTRSCTSSACTGGPLWMTLAMWIQCVVPSGPPCSTACLLMSHTIRDVPLVRVHGASSAERKQSVRNQGPTKTMSTIPWSTLWQRWWFPCIIVSDPNRELPAAGRPARQPASQDVQSFFYFTLCVKCLFLKILSWNLLDIMLMAIYFGPAIFLTIGSWTRRQRPIS